MAKVFSFDSETTRRLEQMYMSPEVVAQRKIVVETLQPNDGERLLDIGCGPGFLVEEIGRALRGRGTVCGMDVSESAVELARARCADQPNARFESGEATSLPFPDASFDAITVTQVYEFVEDLGRALAELHRALRPGGRALIVDTDLVDRALALERSRAHAAHTARVGCNTCTTRRCRARSRHGCAMPDSPCASARLSRT